jgi:hypothetical protein
MRGTKKVRCIWEITDLPYPGGDCFAAYGGSQKKPSGGNRREQLKNTSYLLSGFIGTVFATLRLTIVFLSAAKDQSGFFPSKKVLIVLMWV